jgi:DNA repair exonuclease SbcCD ATPase subunit
VKLKSLHVTGFARFNERDFSFAPGLNVVYGPNESGKSTVANAIVAILYGAERKKDAWRPWNGGSFSATLTYDLESGGHIEVQREFDRDAKGLRIYDRNGNDLSAKAGAGKKLVPGEMHLGIPLDVFLNAACVKQQSVAIEEGRDAAPIAAHLAQALDGGPKEDAALGALKRLDDALRVHVGTDRMRNAPLRVRRDALEKQQTARTQARAKLDALDDLRGRIERASHERERLASAETEIERRARALRAGSIAHRLAALREFREQLADMHAHRAGYDDVATFDAEREGELNDLYYAWDFAERTALTALTGASEAALGESELRELAVRRGDIGRIDDTAFDAVTAAAENAARARLDASAAANEAATARHNGEGGKSILGTALALAGITLAASVGFAIAHIWEWAGALLAFALVFATIVFTQSRGRARSRRDAVRKQKRADDALAAERIAASAVAAVLDPLGLPNIDELTRRRDRLRELETRARAAERADERARTMRITADTAAAAFDKLATLLLPDITGERAGLRAAANVRAARKRERNGIDAHLNAIELQKASYLGNDDQYALETELEELIRSGVNPQDVPPSTNARIVEAERANIGESLRVAGDTLSRLQGELQNAETHVADLAAMDEELARLQTDIARLEAFERAIVMGKEILEQRTEEAHQAFARRLEDYAAQTLATITGGRYTQVFVDPTTLIIRVRVPENNAIVALEHLSAGTRDQAYLVVRFAMARMFAEGMETPPLLLDDPFAYWDTERIERCLPIIVAAAQDAQTIVFTSSEEFADAAVASGAQRIDLAAPALL